MKKLLLAILSISLLFLIGCETTDKNGEDNTLIKSQLIEITQEVSELNQDLENLNEQKALLEKQIYDLEEELKETRDILENLIESTNQETRDVLENLVESTNHEIYNTLNSKIEFLEEEILELARYMTGLLYEIAEQIEIINNHRYVILNKNHIAHIQAYDRRLGKTVLYSVKHDPYVNGVYIDTWEYMIYISYEQGYELGFSLLFAFVSEAL